MKFLKTVQTILFVLLLFQFSFAQSQEIYRIKSPENSLYLEVNSKNTNTDGVKVYLKKYSKTLKQQWVLLKNDNNTYTIKNMANGKLMSIFSYNMNRDGNALVLVSKNSSNLQEWKINRSSSNKVSIVNTQSNKVLAPDKNSYRNLNVVVLNRPNNRKKQTWILVPNNSPGGDNFIGIYKNERSGLQMEIKKTGTGFFKAYFKGSCTDESFTGKVNNSGVLVIPLKSNNNAKLEIRNIGNLFNVKITNISQMSRNNQGKCTGGMIEGNYKKQQYNQQDYFSGFFQMSYGNQQMKIVKSGFDSYKAIFSGNCTAETLIGRINNRGDLEIPLRGGYNDKLFIRKNGTLLNVSITNKSIMNSVCRGGTLEGNYLRKNIVTQGFIGGYKIRNGNQLLEIEKSGFDSYKVIFSGNCRAVTLAGRINNREELEIPLRGGYNDKLFIRKNGTVLNVRITNKNIMKNVCGAYSIEGTYDLDSWNGGNNSTNLNFSGRYQLGMQYVNIISMGLNKFRAIFLGNCGLTTKTGTINNNGILEIPFTGENQMQKMLIIKRPNGITIINTSNSPIMGMCRGATLEGFYRMR